MRRDKVIRLGAIVIVLALLLSLLAGAFSVAPAQAATVADSALFVFPTVIGWFSDRFPNSPRIWRILPTGVPGLAFTLMVASATSAVVGAVLGNDPALGQWTFLILPLPMLVITALGWFGRHGEIDADGNEEERPGKRNKWIYRIGGIVVMILTLKLAGIF